MRDADLTFGPLIVRYDDGVLEPRPWTVLQARWAADLAAAAPAGPILELCSGAGHIGQAAASWSGRRLVQVDIDRHACHVARENAGVNGLAASVDVRCGDLDHVLSDTERFPIVLADPPYLPSAEVADWPDDPELAIDGGDDGLALPRECLRVASAHLDDHGVVLLQALGRRQVDRLARDIARVGLAVDEVRAEDERRAIALLRPLSPRPD